MRCQMGYTGLTCAAFLSVPGGETISYSEGGGTVPSKKTKCPPNFLKTIIMLETFENILSVIDITLL